MGSKPNQELILSLLDELERDRNELLDRMIALQAKVELIYRLTEITKRPTETP